MASRNRLTNNSDETEIASLISGDTVFSIPYFQRAYKWKPKRLRQLNSDILQIVDESIDFHFLGAIIVHGRKTNPADPDVYDVIDGQQRITTLFLYLCAVVKKLSQSGEFSEAAGLLQKYLIINRKTKLISSFKLHPCKEDRSQLNWVMRDLLKDEQLKKEIPSLVFNELPGTGTIKGTLRNNYIALVKFIDRQTEQGGLDRLRQVYNALLNSISVVQIDVWDPTNGPKIFDSLNSRQEPMTIGDLVRNEIFTRVADQSPDEIERVDEIHWQPFYKGFKRNGKNLFDQYFFPYGLVFNPNLKKSEVYNALKTEWVSINDPDQIISSLKTYQDAFVDLMTGSNLQEQSKGISSAFNNLRLSQLPSSTLPFLMQLSHGLTLGDIEESDGIGILNIIESFLVRRAVCGIEPTGLHAVFKRLWKDCDSKPNPDIVAAAIKKHKTIAWPKDSFFRTQIETRSLYGSAIVGYLLKEYDRSLGGDHPDTDFWVEHILPEKPDKSWEGHFTKEEHAEYKDRLANLLPLTKEMNRSLSNGPFKNKVTKYASDSMFKAARSFAKSYEQWTRQELKHRATVLGEWALERWPH